MPDRTRFDCGSLGALPGLWRRRRRI
ncbi:MAG: GlyGly-CTERM sorting domain-containing protein [Chromatiales bacterium]|nr:MAG: GlyGly-CTERM sorting domain-containing protein [Chromatiales bacterium]